MPAAAVASPMVRVKSGRRSQQQLQEQKQQQKQQQPQQQQQQQQQQEKQVQDQKQQQKQQQQQQQKQQPKQPKQQQQKQQQQPNETNEKSERKSVTKSGLQPPAYSLQCNNGGGLVEAAMQNLGWSKCSDKAGENWKLRWTETKGMVNYNSFREGEQLVNHIPNCSVICNKLGLLTSLREYERVSLNMKTRAPRLLMADFFPETFVMDFPREREAFFETYRPGEIWINKPTGLNQGKGIFLIRDIEKFKEELSAKEASKQPSVASGKTMGRIVQRYIMQPLLLNERKFDIRAYMLVGSTAPFLVLFHHGYIRLSIQKYDTEDVNLGTHLTNQYIQKKDERYAEAKDDTVWSMEQFNDYLNSLLDDEEKQKKLGQGPPPEKDWTFKGLERQMKVILQHMFSAVRNRLNARLGYFELYGVDFMVDSDFKVFLIEVNTNPAMQVKCQLLKEILPPLIERSINIALECFEKSKRNRSLTPLKHLGSFQILHNSSGSAAQSLQQSRMRPQPRRATSPQKRK